MHQPRPHGYFGPTDLQAEDAAFAERLMRTVTNLKQAGGLEGLRLTRALPGGGTVTALDMGGVQKVFVKPPAYERPEGNDRDVGPGFVPMLFSGVVVRDTALQPGQKTVIRVTRQTRKRAAGYKKGEDAKIPDRMELERFTIKYHGSFSEFEPRQPDAPQPTQYAKLRATWYSGAMAQVVQTVLGYGKRNVKSADRLEKMAMPLPDGVAEQMAQQVKKLPRHGCTGIPPKDGQLRYDYKFGLTNGVTFGADGKPWLVRVDGRGVYVMPLPLVTASTTGAFKKFIADKGDTEIQWLIEKFGGMPSGEAFPDGAAGKAWERAGVIVRVCDTAQFYEHGPYTLASGWSFNSKGSEAYNTAWSVNEKGIKIGVTFALALRVGALTYRKDGATTGNPSQQEVQAIGKYMAAVSTVGKKHPAQWPAVQYKMRRAGVNAIVERAKSAANPEAEFYYWDNLVDTPLATASGSCREVSRGNVFHPAKPEFQPSFKFPDPAIGACVSFDLRPVRVDGADGERVKCDTVIYAYFVGDDLKTIKYFYDDTEKGKEDESNFTDCMTVGSWQSTSYGGKVGLHGNFYSSDKDDRQAFGQSVSVTNIVGKDLGYDTIPQFQFDAPFFSDGMLFRDRYFTHDVKTQTSESKSRNLAVCIPFYARNAALYARRDEIAKATTSTHRQLLAVRDPNSYGFWTYDKVFHYRLGPSGVKKSFAWEDAGFPKDASPVWVEEHHYNKTPCGDFADSGGWISGMPADYTWLIHPKAGEYRMSGGGTPPAVYPNTSNTERKNVREGALDVQLRDTAEHLHSDPDPLYFLPSPTPIGNSYFYRSMCRVEAGTTRYAWVSEPGGKFGYARLADEARPYCFIGVINE